MTRAGHAEPGLAAVQRILKTAFECARELDLAVAVVVVDGHGHPVALQGMDGAPWVSLRICLGKAFAAAAFGPFSDGTQSMFEGPATSGFWRTAPTFFGGEVVYGDGGVPIVVGGRVIGAVDVSGGTGAQDRECAEHGIRAPFGERSDGGSGPTGR